MIDILVCKVIELKNSFHINITININMLSLLYNHQYYQYYYHYHYNYYIIVVKYLTISTSIINEMPLLDNIYHQFINAAKVLLPFNV